MRILHAAIFNEDGCGRSFYAIDYKLNRAFTELGHVVLPFSYRDVARRSNIFRVKKLGIKEMNRRLVKTAKTFQPELLLIGKGELIFPGTIAAIREALPNIRVALWTCDPINYVATELLALAQHSEAIFSTMTGRVVRGLEADAGIPVHFMPNPVDAGVERDFSVGPDVDGPALVWIGSVRGEADREAFARWVKGYPGGKVYACLEQPKIIGQDYLSLLGRAKIVTGYNRYHDVPWYCSDRTSHVMGSGGFLLTRYFLGIEDFFERGVHCDWFENQDEAAELAERYLGDDRLRRSVAAAGRARAHDQFAHTKVAQHMLNCVFDDDDHLYRVPSARANQGPGELIAAGS